MNFILRMKGLRKNILSEFFYYLYDYDGYD